MSSHYKYHSEVGEIVPIEANYTFPSQAVRANKTSIKYPPKELGIFNSSTLRTANIEFPADNYINFRESALQMDVEWLKPDLQSTLSTSAGSKMPLVQLQPGGAQNLISNLKVMYGSQPFEEIRDYHTIFRIVMESGVNPAYIASSLGILEGSAITKLRNVEPTARGLARGPYGFRQAKSDAGAGFPTALVPDDGSIVFQPTETVPANNADAVAQHVIMTSVNGNDIFPPSSYTGTAGTFPTQRGGYQMQINPAMANASMVASYLNQFLFGSATEAARYSGRDNTSDDENRCKRTYVLNLLSGLLNIDKLFPAKWTAAQLKIQITFETEARAALWMRTSGDSPVDDPRYQITNLAYITELVDFDSAYDSAIYMALQQQGIPLRFSSFHLHSTQLSGTRQIVQIHERSRSIRCAFAVVKDNTAASGLYYADSDTFYHNGCCFPSNDSNYRGRMAIATDGGNNSNISRTYILGDGAVVSSTAEQMYTTSGRAYKEATFNIQGGLSTFQWRVGGRYYPSQPVRCSYGGAEAMMELQQAFNSFGDMVSGAMNIDQHSWTTSHGGVGNKFIIAGEFETTTGGRGEMNGINAEEQNDLALELNWRGIGPVNKRLDIFVYFDVLLIVRAGNDIDMIL